ncbi:pseudouridine synthase [Nesterenkonia halotolerans]|uniref:RNA pseudouridylate synthase n=1 Tax=Nesterenkonia halotolerans TaxID=225325 RepID=A0ABR9J985_9MICC|nr:pseudouridine synthase [Nesterenkonia halotolerans]MBE1515556.1 tRNA pseudouridine32 synthase/23S rRNA pseudouridine746 synthase [Nesterenkonia halotolerans]
MTQKSPLPVRNGVNATRLRLPLTGRWPTIHDYVLETFGHIDHGGITERFHAGEVVDIDGAPLSTTTPLGEREFLWYYRSVSEEVPLPVREEIIYENEHLVAVDKPHFLPTTPAGRYVQESLLVRLRNTLGVPDLVPIHRLDRGTAGVVIFSKEPSTRGKYQLLFENRQVNKTYECVSAVPRGMTAETLASRFPLSVRNRIEKTKGVVVSQLASYAPEHSGHRPHDRRARTGKRRTEAIPGANSSSRVELLGAGTSPSGEQVGHFQLIPHTGKTHQLRIHMALLGLGILNDRFYPELLDDAPDEFDKPLQLLAKTLSFTDPLNGVPRSFTSPRTLQESPQ